MIRFRFNDPVQIISSQSWIQATMNSWSSLPARKRNRLIKKRYGEKIRGTDVTYEDISQTLSLLGLIRRSSARRSSSKDGATAGSCASIIHARGLGPYRVVKAWIDKENSALLRVEGYDMEGRIIKRFEVSNVQKDRDAGVWVLEAMRVETINPGKGRKSDTTMSLSKPVRRK